MVFDRIVIHYDEIGIKGSNRAVFEKLLIRNILKKLGDLAYNCIRESGQLITFLEDGSDLDKVKDILRRIPGIAFFSPAARCGLDLDEMKKLTLELLSGREFDTFRIYTRRANKDFPHRSMDINCAIGDAVVEKYDKKVKMKGADITVKVEISLKHVYVSLEQVPGVGGLPTDQRQKVVCMLSGGFDSPVAAYMMMKRGCEVIFVHFNNKNQESCSVKNKIIDLAKQLSKYQIKTKLYIIPFERLQKEIIMNVHSEQRMLIYRRFMLKISSAIAKIEKARFLVVGDSLSQVASQTLDNLEATYSGIDTNIFTPLIGLHKKEIMAISREIGTHDISEQPYGDCCSYFLPKHPELHANKGLILENEERFDTDASVKDAVESAVLSEF
ncbi:tRNA 4-thiouridine(8) synthase ThiI [Candidatus Woesearchaeota archaeon CG08_land_8_20_14_0_20_43_7]|nr:MAG: tRNA 4-thiouridine(8) synthase ThiI [Candidatus Woesearchaeota archaeon CG08_land_8_20_14_0_20_43_7]